MRGVFQEPADAATLIRRLFCAAVAVCVVGLGFVARLAADDLSKLSSVVASFDVLTDPTQPAPPNANSSAASPNQSSAQAAERSAAATAPPETPPEPWFLMKSLQGTAFGELLKREKIEISGWTDMSFNASTDRSSNLPLGFDYRANEFLLDQNWLRIDRPVDTTSNDPSYGFRSDTILPGSDYRFTLARGLFSGQLSADNGQPNLYGFDPIQFYAEAYYPGIAKGMDVKIGHFFSLYGVETTDTINTPLFSHAYTDLYDPFTHTGIVTTTKLTDQWTVQAGLVLGSDVFVDPADEPTFIGSAKWTSANQKDTLLFSVIIGSARFNQERNFHDPDVFDLVYTRTISDKLTYNLEGLFGFTTNVPDISTADWFGILNYLTYQFTPKMSATTRLEFFDDVQGERTGFPGLYTAITGGLGFKPYPWLIIRPELRFDVNGESRPFENKHELFTAASDLILRW